MHGYSLHYSLRICIYKMNSVVVFNIIVILPYKIITNHLRWDFVDQLANMKLLQ